MDEQADCDLVDGSAESERSSDSGIFSDTNVPLPWRRVRMPELASVASALPTVLRFTPNSVAKVISGGIVSPDL
jgi:hypothetical protein